MPVHMFPNQSYPCVGPHGGWVPAAVVLLTASLFSLPGAAVAEIVVNEASAYVPDYVELYNDGASGVDLNGWELRTTGCGDASSFLPAFTLAAGQYVKLVEESGSDTGDTLFLGGSICWSSVAGQPGSAALLDSGGTGVDFVRWGGSSALAPAGTAWSESAALANPVTRILGRDSSGTDSDDGSDWCLQRPSARRRNAGCTAYLVKDIRPGSTGSFDQSNGNANEYTRPAGMNGKLYFVANDGSNGFELRKSDGTEAGTVQVKDIWSGGGSAFPYSSSSTWFSQTPTPLNGTLFFAARSGASNNYELWKSDGTEAGTVRVRDIYPGDFGSFPNNFTACGGTLYFTADDGVKGLELWKSDGTEAGTVRVKDIYPGATGSDPDYLTDVGGTLFFAASDDVKGNELWKSDGTEAGTVRVKDVKPGISGSGVSRLTAVGDTLFFRANDGVLGHELWKSDGTEPGTVMVKEIATEAYGINRGGSPESLTDVGGTLFFIADDQEGSSLVHGYELWKSDGTEAGTVMVKDIYPGVSGSWPMFLTNVGGTLFFVAYDGFYGGVSEDIELWKSDGTETGTVMVKDVYPGINPVNQFPRYLTAAGGTVYFRADEGVSGEELWRSDGTAAGTVLVSDCWPGGGESYPYWLTEVDGTLFFRAADPTNGRELWAVALPLLFADGFESGDTSAWSATVGAP